MTDTTPETVATPAPTPRNRAPRGRGGKTPPPKAAAPRRPPNPVLERLFELYPKMFGARFLPLKLGVYQELLALHPEDFKKDELKLALGQHARSTRYLEAVAAGGKRCNLQGEPVEDLSPEHVHHAIMEVFRRRHARNPVDALAWRRARLVAAIEASGLSREEYTLTARAQDELSLAALEEAFATIGEKTARREALQRAYKASGRSVEEFAEMYGMDLATVQQALA